MDSNLNLDRTEFNLEGKEQNQSSFLGELTSDLQSSQMGQEEKGENITGPTNCEAGQTSGQKRGTKRQEHGWQPAAPRY